MRKYSGLFSDSSNKTLILDESDWENESPEPPVVSTGADDLAYVIHTSGSTGNPKGVMVRHRNVANFFAAMDGVLKPSGGTWLAVTSLSFDISVLELLWTLARGFTVVLGSPVKPARETTILGHRDLPVDFSLFFFAASSAQIQGQRDQYRLLLESARFADEHGFVAIWSPERHFHSFGGLYPNPAITNAALATITRNVRLRAGSLVAPLHHPIRMAEEWAMVDNLSGGRVDAAFAAGWQPNDFVLQPQNFERRKEVMFEQIDTIQKLWAGESVDFTRADGQSVSVSTLPRPVQNRFPVWITAAGNPETFEMAAEKGYNILTHLLGQSIEELSEKIRLYRDTAKKAGHAGGKITLMLHTFIGDSPDSVREIVREPMKAYLSTAMNLVKEAAWSFPTFKEMTMTEEGRFSMEHLSGDDQEAILNYAFDRYFEGGGLFGSVESCAPFVDRLKAVGVDEIGCLIDYGVDVDLVLSSLPELARLLRESNPTVSFANDNRQSGDGVFGIPAPFVAGRTEAEAAAELSMYALALREGVSHMQCTPSMARMLVADDEGRRVLGALKHFLVGGEALDADLGRRIVEQTRATVTNMYGPTETTVWSTSYEVKGDEETMPIGRPIANNTVYVLGRDGAPVPEGSIGELYIGGDGVTAGYLNRPDLTDERFVDNPFSASEGKLYRTGDLCRFRSDGMLDFLGRNDHQVKVRGYRIELDEIEKAIRSDSSVGEVAVTVENRNGDPLIVAYVVETSDGSFDADRVRTNLERRLPPYMVPSQFNLLSIFPRTPNGKLDRKALAGQKWRGGKTLDAWMRFSNNYTTVLSKIPVQKVGTDDVVKALTPLWADRYETATKVRERIKLVLDHAKARGLRTGDNPAQWKGHLDQIMPERPKSEDGHHAAVPYPELPAAYKLVKSQVGIGAKALQFAILTACRSGEVRGATWAEIDMENAVWTIPASRMKAAKEHRVPLSPAALNILAEMKRIQLNDFVFPGAREGRPLSDMTLAKVMSTAGIGDFTVHGFRSTFRDWAAEETTHQREVAEAALAHAVGDQVERAYRRGDALEKRRLLMRDWAAFCGGGNG